MQLVSFLELFDRKLVLWAYGCMQTTLYIADEPMRSWRSLSAIIDDEARAFRRLAPMAFAEASAHALVAQDASDQVTAAERQAYMHRLPRIRLPCFAGFRNRRTDGCGCTALCYP
jgi:hypothetical protein